MYYNNQGEFIYCNKSSKHIINIRRMKMHTISDLNNCILKRVQNISFMLFSILLLTYIEVSLLITYMLLLFLK